MPIINGRYYSPYGQYSAYVSLQIQRYKSAQANQEYLQLASTAANAFASAGTNLATGLAQIAAQAAVTHAQNAAAAKTASTLSTTNSANTTSTVDLSSILNAVNTTA